MSSEAVISVRGLAKEYVIAHEQRYTTMGEKVAARLRNPFRRPKIERFQALKDVSFDVKRGEAVGIIGRNGAGKSTLLKVLSRITEPTAGEIKLYGRVASLLEVGTGFHPELTGRENIYLNGAILGMRRGEIKKHFDAIVDFAEVERFLDTPVKRYSSGMYVRLAFAVAAHLNPEILIVDEVLAVGDAEFQRKCLGKMQDVSKSEGRTVLFVSHNLSAVQTLCSSGLVLHAGNMVRRGGTMDCIDFYTNAQADDSGTIASSFDMQTQDLRIKSVSVNGSEARVQELTAGQRALRIDVDIEVFKALHADLELTLVDQHDTPLAFFSTGHAQGDTPLVPEGELRLRRTVMLPEGLNRGTYYVTLELTWHNICYWARSPRAFVLDVHGEPTATGRALAYDERKGFISLKSGEVASAAPGS